MLPSYIGRYQVKNEIARGGFAVVARAYDEELECDVAIKILHAALSDGADFKERFINEARLLRRVHSPYVVTVHDVGRLADGQPYMVMDLADRGTLRERLSLEGSQDWQALSNVVDALADGISALHEADIVHRDIKPENILFQSTHTRSAVKTDDTYSLMTRGERLLIGDVGIAKDMADGDSINTVIGGTQRFQAPEQEERGARIAKTADIYSATALVWQIFTGTRPPLVDDLAGVATSLPDSWQVFFERGMAKAPLSRIPDVEVWRTMAQAAIGEMGKDNLDDMMTRIDIALDANSQCPYKGLASYQPSDAASFFGRETMVDDLINRMALQNVLVVGGPSGSGKSSLVRAGLIPALAHGALSDSENWDVRLFTPGSDPISALYSHIQSVTGNTGGLTLSDILSRPAAIGSLLLNNRDPSPLLLCIDQFEEMFTLAPEDQQAGFLEALASLVDPVDSQVRIVIMVRADFYSACARNGWLADKISQNQVLVGPMSVSDLRHAIVEPARQVGLFVENGLVETLLHDAAGEAGTLPLMAHALVETWSRKAGKTLTLSDYRDAGGITGAISQTAETLHEHGFNKSQQTACYRLLLRLVTPGDGVPDTRRILNRSSTENDPDTAALNHVIDALTSARLLSVDTDTIQIAHEALLHTWPRLRNWIDAARDDLRVRQRITQSARDWENNGEDAEALYRGVQLLSALEWRQNHANQLDELEARFLDQSEEAKIAIEAAHAATEKRRARTRTLVGVGLATLALLATGGLVLALLAFDSANKNSELARMATRDAQIQFTGALGAAAQNLTSSDPLLALALSTEALARGDQTTTSYEALAALIEARQTLSKQLIYPFGAPIAVGDATSIALSPDGSLLASGERSGNIRLYDVIKRKERTLRLKAHTKGIEDLDFSPNGAFLISTGSDGAIRLWDMDAEGSASKLLFQASDTVWSSRFSPDGKRIVLASEEGLVRLIDTNKAEVIGDPLISRTGDFLVADFTPNGNQIYAANGDGDIFGFDHGNLGAHAVTTNVHSSDVWNLVFDSRSEKMVTTSSDGSASIFNMESGIWEENIFGKGTRVRGVAFTNSAAWVIGGHDRGTLKIYDIEKQALLGETESHHNGSIIDIVTAKDGQLIASLGIDQTVRLWQMGKGVPLADLAQVEGRKARGLAQSITKEGTHLLAAADETGRIHLWQSASETELLNAPAKVFKSGDTGIWALKFSDNNERLFAASRDGNISAFNLPDAKMLWRVRANTPIWSLAINADNSKLYYAGGGIIGHLRATDGTNHLQEEALDGTEITRLTTVSDLDILAATTNKGLLKFFTATTLEEIVSLNLSDDVLWSVTATKNGELIAVGTADDRVVLIDRESNDTLAEISGFSGGVTDLVFFHDDTMLVAIDRSGSLHFIDIPHYARIGMPIKAHSKTAWRLSTAANHLVTAGDDGLVKRWTILNSDISCTLIGNTFDKEQQTRYLGSNEMARAC